MLWLAEGEATAGILDVDKVPTDGPGVSNELDPLAAGVKLQP